MFPVYGMEISGRNPIFIPYTGKKSRSVHPWGHVSFGLDWFNYFDFFWTQTDEYSIYLEELILRRI